MKKYIPNLLTCLSLSAGCITCLMAFHGEYLWVVVWTLIAAVFDFLDGFMARLLKAYSEIGKELDSLSDMVSFGLAPGITVFTLLSGYSLTIPVLEMLNPFLPYTAFILTIFSALRLAKFNIDTRQSITFIGLPTPANALFWISFCYGLHTQMNNGLFLLTILLIIGFSLLLTSELPMFSLKAKSLKIKGNEFRYLLIIFLIIAILLLNILGIAAGIVFYIGLSLFSYLRKTA